MPDTVILDTNILLDIARGNQRAAEALTRYIKSGTPVYISRAAYDELVTRAKTTQAGGQYREILSDLRINIADSGKMADRINVIADNIDLNPAPGAPGRMKEYDRKNDPTKPGDVFVAAQAKAINAKLWTLDRDLARRATQFGVQLAPECNLPATTERNDVPDNARQLLGLNPKPIGVNGLPLPPKGGSGGGNGGSGGGAGGTYSLVGVADNTLPEVGGLSPKGEAIGAGIQIALEGLNFVLNLINNYVQKNKVNAALDPIKPQIAKARSDNPRMGVILLFYYAQVEAPDESPIKPGADFQYLLWGVGATPDEATQDALRPGSISRATGPFEKRFSQQVWIPPLQKSSITAAKCPFPPVAIGRFVLGKGNRASFQDVAFDVLGGFDDIVETTVDLPPNSNADFAILNPPAEVYWYNIAGRQTVKVPLKDAKTANNNTIKVVDLDPWLPFDTTAAMVFPIDDWSEKVFNVVGQTQNCAILAYVNFGMIRWIRPENIQLLRFL
jgi:predicted nucleic acid-binding protein